MIKQVLDAEKALKLVQAGRYFNFDRNFNNKLVCEYLTTIRASGEKTKAIKLGMNVVVTLNRVPLFFAKVRSKVDFDSFIEVPRYVLDLDMGPGALETCTKLFDGEPVTLFVLQRLSDLLEPELPGIPSGWVGETEIVLQ